MTTEGDSFTVAFHDAFDAVAWALATQSALLSADWPAELMSHPKAHTEYAVDSSSDAKGQLLFRGLRVRMAVSTGVTQHRQDPHLLHNQHPQRWLQMYVLFLAGLNGHGAFILELSSSLMALIFPFHSH